MSIPRYGDPFQSALPEAHPNGWFVAYTDHLTKIEQIDEMWRKQAPYILGVEAEQQRIVTLIEAMCIAGEHYDASHVYYESEYVLCDNCKYTIAAIKGDSDE